MKRTYCTPQIEIDEVEACLVMASQTGTTLPYNKESTGSTTPDNFGNSTLFDDGEDTTSPIWDD